MTRHHRSPSSAPSYHSRSRSRSRSLSPSRSRSSSAGPYYRTQRSAHNRTSVKKTAVLVAAVAVAALCVHRFLQRRRRRRQHKSAGENRQDWDYVPGRRSRRRNVIRDRHNGYYIDGDSRSRQLSEGSRGERRGGSYAASVRSRDGWRSRDVGGYGSDGDSYYPEYHPPYPGQQQQQQPPYPDSRDRIDVDRWGRRREIVGEDENAAAAAAAAAPAPAPTPAPTPAAPVLNGQKEDLVRYEKQSTRSEPESVAAGRFVEEDRRHRRRRHDRGTDDWRPQYATQTDEPKAETVRDDRKSGWWSRWNVNPNYY